MLWSVGTHFGNGNVNAFLCDSGTGDAKTGVFLQIDASFWVRVIAARERTRANSVGTYLDRFFIIFYLI
jgi:hypothetical protein